MSGSPTIPALAEADDPLSRAEGDALWPERFPVEVLEKRRRALGNWMFEAIYQSNPVPREGEFFTRSTFRYWRSRGDQLVLEGAARRAGKDVRANHATALCEAGNAYFPQDAGWLYEWEKELLGFTGAGNDVDDQVDAFSMAAILIAEGNIGGRRRSLAGWDSTSGLHRRPPRSHYQGGSPNIP